MARGKGKDTRKSKSEYYSELKASQPTLADLKKEYRKLAKRADQRMVRIEQLEAKGGIYQNVTKYAYRAAQREIRRFGGEANEEGKMRFNQNMPLNYNALIGKTAAIRRFLDAPTSSKRGIDTVFKDKAAIYNAATGSDFTWQQFANYWQSGLADKLASYGYATRNAAIAVIKKRMDAVKNDINDANEKIENISDEVVDIKVKEILAKYGKEIEDMLN